MTNQDLGSATGYKVEDRFSTATAQYELLRFKLHTSTLVGGRVFVVGGQKGKAANGSVANTHVYALDYSTFQWEAFIEDLPAELHREYHKTVLYRDSLFVFGGLVNGRPRDDLWQIDLLLKRVLPCEMTPGGPGMLHDWSADLVEATGDLVVFGGVSDRGSRFNTLHVMKMASKAWHEPKVKGKPPSPRSSHATATTPSALVLFGGYDSAGYLADLHVLAAENGGYAWSEPICSGTYPAARHSAALAFVNGRVFVYGGFESKGPSADFAVLALKEQRWIETWDSLKAKPTSSSVKVLGNMPKMVYHSLVALPSRLLIVGGGLTPAANKVYFIRAYEGDDFYKRPSKAIPPGTAANT